MYGPFGCYGFFAADDERMVYNLNYKIITAYIHYRVAQVTVNAGYRFFMIVRYNVKGIAKGFIFLEIYL